MRRVALALTLLAAAGACERPAPPAEPQPPQRIVLVTIDTLRADHVGSYGADFARTPTLDALAEEGVRFENAIAPQPLTRPSHATLLTGLDPPQHGLRDNALLVLPDGLPTLAGRLREAGYATAAVVSARLLRGEDGFGRGFDHYDDVLKGARRGWPGYQRRADASVDAALEWVSRAPGRFFLWLHLYDPHQPYHAPGLLRRWLAASPYDAEISFADAELGRLLRGLEQRWDDGRTLVVATSDHGESLGEHGENTHGYGVYDATQRVPLLLAGSGLPRGRTVASVVSLADLAPTILALAGAEPLPAASGRDLRPLWEGVAGPPRYAYVETLATQLDWGWSPLLGLRGDALKYVRAPVPELYDLRDDPDELRNVAAERPELVARLDARLSERLAGALEPRIGALDAETRAQLEALGYVAGGAPVDAARLGRVGGPDPKAHVAAIPIYEDALREVDAGHGRRALELLGTIEAEFPIVEALRAQAALLADQPSLAEHHARKAIEAGFERDYVYVRLGNALGRLGRTDEAEAAMRRAAELQPDSLDPILGLASLAEARGRLEEAEALYRRALAKPLDHPKTSYRLAALLLERGRPEEAGELLESLDPEALELPEAAARIALAEARTGRRRDGLARVERALRRSPDSPVLLEARALLGGG